jgi:C4-dicarboxylate-specific signal transduction histidine kinase
MLCADGTARLMLVSCKAELDGTGKAVNLVGTVQDITESRQAHDALRAAQSELARVTRLTAVGQAAASIAHEINQPLAAIITNAEAGLRLLKNERPDLAEACEALTEIVGDGHRVSQVIGGIRALLKKDSQEKAPLDVNQIIREVLALVGGELRSQHILVQVDLSEPLPRVSGVRIQLQEVILNLLTNATEAIGSTSGRAQVIRVSSARREPDNVLITVEDSGPGIDPKDLDHIFDPFFSTKSHGMGMGLSICRSIVEAHAGHLSVSPGASGGAVFQIILPAGKAAGAR